MSKLVKIAMAGEGGQGVQSVASILVDAANDEGKEALYIPNFGVEQRGGVSIAYCQISDLKIGAPKFEKADIIIALSDRAVRRCAQYVGPNSVFIYDTSIEGIEEDLPKAPVTVLGIPALKIAKEELHPRVFNVIILGATIKATGVMTLEQAKKALEKKLGYKFEQNPKLRELNFQALERGMELVDFQK
jgi:2-oxoglutarate ferredoxin oxidoreductase subunit gamma